jgi:hypothetical protein
MFENKMVKKIFEPKKDEVNEHLGYPKTKNLTVCVNQPVVTA